MPPRSYPTGAFDAGQTDRILPTGEPLATPDSVPSSGTSIAPPVPTQTPPRPPRDDHASIDSIIRNGYLSVPARPPETAPIADRTWVAGAAVEDVIAQIQARHAIYQRNMQGILYATCAATNALHQWKAERGLPSDRQLDTLHRTLQGLYEQERAERQALWRDLSRLRVGLAELAGQYLSATRKLELLGPPDGDHQ